MEVTFFNTDPHGQARPELDQILSSGTDRIMIACAFCTGAGAAIIERHLPRLRKPGSCLVVSAECPTDVAAVNALAEAAPGAVWLHETDRRPYEKKVGSALMHSKVFYSEAGEQCWLWVGSHNLTGSATQGSNLEAAVLLAGHPWERVFVAAREHIEACRAEARPCPVNLPVAPLGEVVDGVEIHTESESIPTRAMPWHARLGLRSANFDSLLRPVLMVRLHLYAPGALARGWRTADPWASYAGSLTGLNLTDIHPENPGVRATWSEEHFAITEERGVLYFSETIPRSEGIVTQAVLNIDGIAPPGEVFLPIRPRTSSEDEVHSRSLGRVDPDLVRFFERSSLSDGHLIYDILRPGRLRWEFPLEDMRPREQEKLRLDAERFDAEVSDLPEFVPPGLRHPFIRRIRFQLQTE